MTARRPIVLTGGNLRQIASGETLTLNGGVTGGAPLNVPQGSAPTSPADGDFWTTTAGLFIRINGATIGPLGTTLISVGTSAPSSPSAGTLWWKSDEGRLKVYYTDVDTSQWVDAFPAVPGPPGPTGSTGSTGATGATGATGPAASFDKARVYLNTATNTTAAGWQKVPIDTVDFDTAPIWNSTSKRFIPVHSGYYSVNGRVRCNTAGASGIVAGVGKNGAQTYGLGTDSVTTSNFASGGGALIFCNGSTDYLELWVFSANARALTTGSFDTFMDVVGPF